MEMSPNSDNRFTAAPTNHTKGNEMKNYLLIALLLAAGPAIATTPPNPCGNHGNNCDPDPPTTTPVPNEQNQGQLQGQAQGQGQGQGQIATGGNGTGIGLGGSGGAGGQGGSATGGSAQGGAGGTATSGSASGAVSGSLSGVQGSGNASLGDVGSTSAADALSNASNGDQSLSGTQTTDVANGSASNSGATANGTVNVDAADRSSTRYSNRTNVFVPGDLPANAMTIAPGATITVAGDTQCGVLLTKVRIPVYQWDKKGKTKREVGYDEDVAPFVDANGVQIDFQRVDTGNGGYYLRGSHATYIASTYGSSTSSQLGLQGYGPGGGGGISAGKGSSYSQAGVRIVIRPCISSVMDPVEQLPLIQFKEPRVPRG
jgi:hypothetical protein